MKNELGIEKKCENCHFSYGSICDNGYYCRKEKGNPKKDFKSFTPSFPAYESRIKELQEQQFTTKEAEKIETFLTHGYQMMINKNKKIFSKLEKMKGEQ